MYEIKPYVDGNIIYSVTYYGVYYKYSYNGYKEDKTGNNNLIVLCYNEENAKAIVDILSKDDKQREDELGY